MKKIVLIFTSMILLNSCVKEYKCRCKVTTTSTIIDSVTYRDIINIESYELITKATKKGAKQGECSSYHKESSKDGNPIITDKTCTINVN